MPNRSRGRARGQLTGVKVTDQLMYCFKTAENLDAGVSGVSGSDIVDQLGHVVIDVSTGSGPSGLIGILGSDSPKPPRVTKKDKTRGTSISTYCAIDKFSDAIKAGWAVQKTALLRGLTRSKIKLKVFVPVFNVLYMWSMDEDDYTSLAGDLGLSSAADTVFGSSEQGRIIFGASTPRPGKVWLRDISAASGPLSSGDKGYSSFYDPDKADDLIKVAKRITYPVPPVFGI